MLVPHLDIFLLLKRLEETSLMSTNYHCCTKCKVRLYDMWMFRGELETVYCWDRFLLGNGDLRLNQIIDSSRSSHSTREGKKKIQNKIK